MTTNVFVAHVRSRICCDALDILKGLGYSTCKLEVEELSKDVASSVTVFFEGGLRIKNRTLLHIPNDLEKRRLFIEDRGLNVPNWVLRAHRLVGIRPTADGDVYHGDERKLLIQHLEKLCEVKPFRERKRKRRSWQYGRTARRLQERQGVAA